MELTELEKENGTKAFEVIKKAGGQVTFDEFDKLMSEVRYWYPIHWGWAGAHMGKPNGDKLCVFSACAMGLVKQTKTGYKL